MIRFKSSINKLFVWFLYSFLELFIMLVRSTYFPFLGLPYLVGRQCHTLLCFFHEMVKVLCPMDTDKTCFTLSWLLSLLGTDFQLLCNMSIASLSYTTCRSQRIVGVYLLWRWQMVWNMNPRQLQHQHAYLKLGMLFVYLLHKEQQ